MVRNRERTKNRGVPQARVDLAMRAVEAGEKIRRAAETYKINHVTLSRYIQTKKGGRDLKISYKPASLVISEAEEGVLEADVLKAADDFVGLCPWASGPWPMNG